MTKSTSTAWFSRVVILISAAAILVASIALALTQRPRTMRTAGDRPPGAGSEIRVGPNGNFQEALNRAGPDDVIVLESGSVYEGPFRLPRKTGNSYITIKSSRAAELPEGARVGPGQSGLFAKLQAIRNGDIVITTDPGAHHYRFIGIEFSAAHAGLRSYDLVRFGDGRPAQTTIASVPHHLVIDRCYIHGFATQEVQRGLTLNSAETSVINSYISDIHGKGYDTQAVAGWNGPGPFHIVNNYLEAAGENLMFGGADPSVPNLIPSDIEIRRNHFFKPLSWKVGDPSYAGIHWTIKNLLELKLGRNVTIDGNVFENSWTDAQAGYAVLFTVRNQGGTAPWAIVENVTFSNNIVKGARSGIQTLGMDYNHLSQQSTGLRVVNNVFDNIEHWCLTLNGFHNVTWEHNTLFQGNNNITFTSKQSLGFVYRNNLTVRSGFGFFGDGGTEGTAALTAYCPSYVFAGNVIVGASTTKYPAGNFYPATLGEVQVNDYRLSTTSPFKGKGTDGKDPGADMTSLLAAQAGSVSLPAGKKAL